MVALAAALVATPLAAQTYQGMTIPSTGGALGSGHPRLLFGSSANYSQAQAWYTANYADVNPGTCSPEVSNFDVCTNLAFQHAMNPSVDATEAIATALVIMNQATADPSIVSCSPGGGDDVANSYHDCAINLILIFDWTYDEMTSTQKSEYIAGGNVWFGEYNSGSSVGTIGANCQGGGFDNNYCEAYTQAAFAWGIAAYWEDTSIAQQDLDQWNTNWGNYKTYRVRTTLNAGGGNWQSAGAGGVSQEGPGYGTLVTHDFVVPTITGYSLGRDLFSENPDFLATPLWYIWNTNTEATTTNNTLGTPVTQTCWDTFIWNVLTATPCQGYLAYNNNAGASNGNTADIMSMLATHYAGTNIGGYAQEWLASVGSGTPDQIPLTPWIQALYTAPSPVAYSGLPLDYFAPGSGFLYLRKAWDSGATTTVNLNFNTASEVSHATSWPGDWQMWRGGRWLSRNTAQYNPPGPTGWNNVGMESANMTLNTLLVNPNNQGCTAGTTCQGDGAEYAGDILMLGYPPLYSVETPAQVSRLQDGADFAYAMVDLSGVYGYSSCTNGGTGASCNPAVNTVQREFVWVRDLETLVIFDRVLANAVGGTAAGSIVRTDLAHCEYAWTIVDANHASCVDGSQELYYTVLLPTTPNPALTVVNEYTGYSDPNAQYRLEVNDTPGTAQDYIVTVAQGMASTGTPLSPTISLSGSTYTVTLDGSHSIQFQQGSTSSGGSITVSGVTTNFSSTVEPVTVSTNGFAWGGGSATGSGATGVVLHGVTLY